MKLRDKLKLVLPVTKNWLSYKYNMLTPSPVGYVIIGVTYHCNCKCKMCNIWESYIKDPGLSHNEIGLDALFKKISASQVIRGVSHIDLTGGEPFLKKGFADFITNLLSLKNIKLVTMNSNGMLTERITQSVRNILDRMPTGKVFSISISIDGIGKLHDEIRGIEGCFEMASKTIEQLCILREEYPNKLELRSNAVVQPKNIDYIEEVIGFWNKNRIKGGLSILQTPFVTHTINAAYNASIFTTEQIEKIKTLPCRSRGVNQYISNNFTRPLHCFAGYSAMFIDPSGNVYPCNFLGENKDYVMGNIKEESIDSIWRSMKAWQIRESIKKCPFTNCWNGCEVDQTILQYNLLDAIIRAVTLNTFGYYNLKGLGRFE